MGITTDRNDDGLKKTKQNGQRENYLVLSDEEKAKGFIRPVLKSYIHNVCGLETTMSLSIAETYARDPSFYSRTFCMECGSHFHVSEFVWSLTGDIVGS